MLESSFQQLYDSAVQAFPNTQKRQFATDTIVIEQLNWTPYVGVRTLFLRGLANNHKGGGKEYKPIILFKNVEYHNAPGEGIVEITASDGHEYYLSPLTREHDILCRCECMDFLYRFNFYDHVDKSLFSKVRKPYTRITENRPPANPNEMPGMCKHLIRLFYSLEDAGLVI